MNKFLLKGLIFFLICIGLAYVLDYMIQEGLKTSNYREITKWNEVIQGGIDAEILIVGSSRAIDHFDCDFLKGVTGKSCYNLGFDGTTFPLQKLILQLYLSNNKSPNVVYWSIDYHSFSQVNDFYGFEQMIPFMENLYIRKMLSIHKKSIYQFLVPIFRYSFNPKMKTIGLYSFFGNYNQKSNLKSGFRKKFGNGTFDNFKEKKMNEYYINFEENIFKDFINLNKKLRKESDVKWILSPYYFEYEVLLKNRGYIQNKLQVSADYLSICFYNFSNNSINFEKKNFQNSLHLSFQGVETFMEELSNVLNN